MNSCHPFKAKFLTDAYTCCICCKNVSMVVYTDVPRMRYISLSERLDGYFVCFVR